MQGKRFKSLIRRRFSSFLTIFLAFLIFNSSIDSPDSRYTMMLKDGSYREDLSKNDIETLFEFITEVLLNKSNAVKETDDQESDQLLKKLDFALIQNYPFNLCSYETESQTHAVPVCQIRLCEILIDIPNPPPELLPA